MRDLLRLAKLALPLWRWVLLGVCLSLATTLAHIGLLALSSWFITSMAIAGIAGAVMNASTPSAGVRALAIARAGGRYAERVVNHDTTFKILAALRVWFFRRIEPLAPAALEMRRGGDLLSRARSDIDTLDDFYVRGVVPSLVAVLSAVCLFLFFLRFDGQLALVEVAALACGGALFPLAISRLARRPGGERVVWAARLRASLAEQVQGMAELEALGAGDFQAARIASAEREMDRRQRRLNSLDGIAEAEITAVSALAAGAAALILADRVAEGALPGPDLAMLTVAVLASFDSVRPLPGVFQRLGEMAAAARRLFEIIDAKPVVADPPDARQDGSQDRVPSALVDLVIRGLSFRYSPDLPWVFRELSLEAPAGSSIGMMGPTGAGKSTLVSILLRFRDYEMGSIQASFGDGMHSRTRELRSMSGDEARALFSVVPQSPYLFHESIKENLLLAKPAAPDEELWSALDAAALSGLVSSLPAGLDTRVGEAGREISGGEARRLAVARALLRDAPVYIFDEPTEGLDDRTAETMLASIAAKLAGRTLIIISHRPRDHRGVSMIYRLRLSGEGST